jgi:uncharacterized membrane protein YfhO
MKVKAGYRTSEFWFTVVSFIFSGLYLMGILKENDQKEELISVVSHAVESTILVGGQMLIFYRYIKGRSEVKKIVEQEKLSEIQRPTTKPKRSKTRAKPKPKTAK